MRFRLPLPRSSSILRGSLAFLRPSLRAFMVSRNCLSCLRTGGMNRRGELMSSEIRFPFLEKRRQTFGAILGCKTVCLQANLFVQRVFHFAALVADHCSLHVAIRQWRTGRQMLGQLPGFFLENLLREDLVDDSSTASFGSRQRFCGIKKFGGA